MTHAPKPEPLLPCPFCGEELVTRGDYNSEEGWNWLQHNYDDIDGGKHACIIGNIKIPLPWHGPCTMKDLWNTRARPTPPEVKHPVEDSQRYIPRDYPDDGGKGQRELICRLNGEIRELKSQLSQAKEGWVLVPKEPTPEMLRAGYIAMQELVVNASHEHRNKMKWVKRQKNGGWCIPQHEKYAVRWKAMIAAAPQAEDKTNV